MGLLPDTQNYGLRMRRECRESKCDQNTSGRFGRLVTLDLAESPILSVRDILYNATM